MNHIPLTQIQFARNGDQTLVNPRGRIVNTTDLQASFTQVGQQEPIRVVEVDGKYLVIDGHRRVAAARALKWELIKAEVEKSDHDLLVKMLASNVRKNFTPLQLGKAIRRMVVEKQWPVEKVARLCGLKVGKAQLYNDLLDAPEAVQKRVDKGEMSLSAWQTLRDKPTPVQEQAAKLEKPTVRAVRKAVREAAGEQKSQGVLTGMLEKLNPEKSLVSELNGVKRRLQSEWHGMASSEKQRIQHLVEEMAGFVKGEEARHAVV